MQLRSLIVGLTLVALLTVPLEAHHSFAAEYDSNKPISISFQGGHPLSKNQYSILSLASALAISGFFWVVPVRAHHSFAVYEPQLQIKFSGTVTVFTWANPHVYIEMDAVDKETNKKRHWLIECANPGILNRVGWKFNMVKPGDTITVIVSPLRNGEPAALLKQITLADGSKYSNGGPAGPATIE